MAIERTRTVTLTEDDFFDEVASVLWWREEPSDADQETLDAMNEGYLQALTEVALVLFDDDVFSKRQTDVKNRIKVRR